MYIAQRSHFASFMPFRSSTKRSLPNNFDLIARSFDDNVLRCLKSLTPISTDSPSLTSLVWLSQAVGFLSSTHVEAQAIIANLRTSSDDTTLSYLDDSVKILDVCNYISSEIERLRQRRLLLRFVLQLLEFSGEDRKIPAADKIRRSKDLLSDWENKPSRKPTTAFDGKGLDAFIGDLAAALGSMPPRGKISSAGHVIRRTIYAVGVLTVFVAGMALAALCGIFQDDIASAGVPSEFIWSDTLKDLQSEILKRGFFQAGSLEEVDAVEKRVRVLRDVVNDIAEVVKDDGKERVTVDEFGNAVKDLEADMERFSSGLDCLADGVNGTFRMVLCNRNAILEEYRKKATNVVVRNKSNVTKNGILVCKLK